MVLHVTLVTTSSHVPPGLLTAPAWDLLRAGPVYCADSAHPQLGALADAGVDVTVVGVDPAGAAGFVAQLRARAEAAGTDTVVWLVDPAPLGAGPGGVVHPDPAELEALGTRTGADAGSVVVRVVAASVDPPGAALLDAVAVMDRLRSPGGCPWDAEQTHASLAFYLIEEAYEAYQAIEDGDLAGLREELGDVLMQVLFHARIATEATSPTSPTPQTSQTSPGTGGWDVDDVAAGLVAKLVRRHPHVFADVVVDGPAAVVTNWDAIKAVEKGRRSVTEGVPMSQPALSLAVKLQHRGAKIGVPVDLVLVDGAPNPAAAVRGLAVNAGSGQLAGVGAGAGAGTGARVGVGAGADDRFGELLFAVVALARQAGVDPELALRAASRRFRDQLAAAEEVVRATGADPSAADADTWRAAWPAG